jgi:hypothetical protein
LRQVNALRPLWLAIPFGPPAAVIVARLVGWPRRRVVAVAAAGLLAQVVAVAILLRVTAA